MLTKRTAARLMAACVAATVCAGAAAAGGAGTGVTALRLAAGHPESGQYTAASRLQGRVNANTPEHGVMLATVATRGAAESAALLRAGRVDLALTQSDMMAAGGGLVPVATLASERFVIVVRDAGGPATVAGLAGLRVGFGPEGSGARHTADRVAAAAGLGAGDLRHAEPEGDAARIGAFCAGRLDALALVVSPADPAVARLLVRCGGRALDFGGSEAASVRTLLPDYALALLPGAGVQTLRVDMVLAAAGRPAPGAAFPQSAMTLRDLRLGRAP
jgi:TRAP-type uncharacterized transport system substrate-binding protein